MSWAPAAILWSVVVPTSVALPIAAHTPVRPTTRPNTPASGMLRKLAQAAVTAAAALTGAEARPRGGGSGSVQCLDNNGSPVDWWIMLKFPKMPDSTGPSWFAQGLGFAYMDVNTGAPLVQSSKDMSSTSMALSSTLQQIYSSSDSSTVAYGLYNDEVPDGTVSETKGHSKGAFAFDSQSGFWLVHSTPRWPPVASASYDFPADETDYGQSFMCLSLASSTMETVAAQLSYIWPDLYDHNLPSSLAASHPAMSALVGGQHITTAGDAGKSVVPFQTLAGATFTSFAKNHQWDNQLYDVLVAETIGSDLRTETWLNGVGKMPSQCSGDYTTENIAGIEVSSQATWVSSKDHSKWVVSDASKHTTCIGGINREVSQATRGGGTVCTTDTNIYSAFNAIGGIL